MSLLSTTIAPAIAPAASIATHGSGAVSRGAETGSSASSIAQHPVASQAAIVTLTQESKARAASSGYEGRRTDATFGGEKSKKNLSNKTEKGSSSSTKATLNVAA